MRTTRSALVLLLLSGTCVYGQSASETVAEYFSAVKTKDYKTSATYFDPAELKNFRQMLALINEMPPAEQKEVLQAFFGPSATQESVSKMSDSDFFATFLRTIMAQVDAGGVNFDDLEILGEVAEGPNVVHVVARNKVSVGEVEMAAIEVISSRNDGNGWKLLLPDKMKSMVAQLRAALSQQAGEE